MEYGAMDAWDYEELALCQEAYAAAQKQFPRNWDAPRERVAPPDGAAAGPQFG